MAEWQLHQTGDTAAIYKDGGLLDSGEVGTMRLRLLAELGVVLVKNDAFLLGQDKRSKIAKTLGEITTWTADRDAKRARLTEIRNEIADLRAEAHDLGDPTP